MVVVVTNDVPDRFRGFLNSVMLEVAPGVYTAPRMTAGIRDRVWDVLEEWFKALGGGSVVMTWADKTQPSGQGLRTLGLPNREFVELEGLITTRADLTDDEQALLQTFQNMGSHSSAHGEPTDDP